MPPAKVVSNRQIFRLPCDASMRLCENGWVDAPEFRPDLYRRTAADYDRFRVPYPQTLIDDLLERAGLIGDGRLLDLACGTGQISFGMHSSFEEIWAVDQEPDMVGFAREKAVADRSAQHHGFTTSSAQEFVAPGESFDLIAIGNAFHRLPRDAVATKVRSGCAPADVSRCCGLNSMARGRAVADRDVGDC